MPTRAVIEKFDAHAKRQPAAPALRWNYSTLSYEELDRLAERLADTVSAETGSLPSPRIAVIGAKSPTLVAVLIACWRLGYSVVLPPASVGATAITELLAGAGVNALINVPGSDASVRVQVLDQVGSAPDLANDVKLILTTSGTTGLPKLVPLHEGALNRFVSWATTTFLEEASTIYNYAPLNFDVTLLDLWAPLAAGCCVELSDPDHSTDGKYLAELLFNARATVVQAVPMFYRLIEDGRSQTFDTVRHALVTGEAVDGDTLAGIRQMFPNARLHNVYGATETNNSFLYEATRSDRAPLPLGAPIPGVDFVIVPLQSECASSEDSLEGELWVRTPFQARRYLGAADVDNSRWTPAPQGGSGEAYFRTGDVVTRDASGIVHLVGRLDHQVKIRGVRTNTRQVEAVLMDHPEVIDAAVVTYPDDLGGSRLHAVVQAADRASSTVAMDIRRHCARNLPRTAVPSSFKLTASRLPRTGTGKLDRDSAARL